MKRMIRSNTLTTQGRDWLVSERVTILVEDMDASEKRLVGKLANSTDPIFYLGTIADTVEVLKIDVSEAFDAFIREGLENLR